MLDMFLNAIRATHPGIAIDKIPYFDLLDHQYKVDAHAMNKEWDEYKKKNNLKFDDDK